MAGSKAKSNQDPMNTGQGSHGMGGQPSDKTRDIRGGGGDPMDDRGAGTGPIPGATGRDQGGAPLGGGTAGVGGVGPMGDKGITEAGPGTPAAAGGELKGGLEGTDRDRGGAGETTDHTSQGTQQR